MSYNPVRPQRVGNLRHKITWQEKVGEDWLERETEPARVEPIKGREVFASNETIAESTYRVFARYRRVPDTANWRVVWWTGHVVDDKAERLIFDIIAVSNPDERRRFTEMLCENTNAQSDPPSPEPGENDGLLENEGDPFGSTTGWTAVSGAVSIDGQFGSDLQVTGVAVSPIETTIGRDYRITCEAGSFSPDDVTVGASNNSDGSTPLETSDPISGGNSDSIEFTATAETTYCVLTTTGSTSWVAGVVSELLPE